MHTTRLRAAVLGAGVALLAVTTAGAAAAAAPQLTIAIDNGRTSTAAGETLNYTITVRNLGTADLTNLTVTQSVPAGLMVDSAIGVDEAVAPTRTDDVVTWTVDIATAGEVTLRSTMTVTDTPPELLRLASVACASETAGGPPLVCASHSAQLPAGAADTAARAEAAAPPGGSGTMWREIIGVAVLALVAAGIAFAIRRRLARRGHHTTA